MPSLFPEFVEPIAKVLRENPRLAFRYRWNRRAKEFGEIFKWSPSEFVDAEDVAKENGIGHSLDDMAERIVGGPHCRRGSNFGDFAVPSVVALHHRAIRVTLIYEFVVTVGKYRELRDQNRSHSADSRGGGGKRRKIDREIENFQQRQNRK